MKTALCLGVHRYCHAAEHGANCNERLPAGRLHLKTWSGLREPQSLPGVGDGGGEGGGGDEGGGGGDESSTGLGGGGGDGEGGGGGWHEAS